MLDFASAEGRGLFAAAISHGLGEPVQVEGTLALSGGASSATYRIDARVAGEPRHFIYQRTDGDGGRHAPRAVQAAVMQRAGLLGMPVPPVVAVPDAEGPLGDSVITGFIEGEALAPRWLRDPAFAEARARLTAQCATALASLHAAPLAHWAGLPVVGCGSGAELLAAMFANYRRFDVDVPAYDLAFAWLKPRLTDAAPTCMVHGDFRAGNLLIDHGGLAAVIDWELPHRSVPAEDLAWLCASAWRFGHWQKPVGGFGTREALVEAYRAAGGTIEPDELRVWEVYGNLKWGVSCLSLCHDHLSGRVPSVERAAIGRRVSEVAADLTYLLAFGDL